MDNITKKITALSVGALVGTMAMSAQFPDRTLHTDSLRAQKLVDLGYMYVPQAAVTGAVSTVSGVELDRSPESNLAKTFAGRLSGLVTMEQNAELSRGAVSSTDAGVGMFIRGRSTTNGRTPLVLLDGVLMPNSDFVYITPEEIESVTVLKDASTTAIYGIQGAAGVISIRTKQGQVGKTKVRVRFDQSFQQMIKKPLFVNSGLYADLRNQAGQNDGLGAYSQFSQEAVNHYKAGDSELYPNNNWYDMFMRPVELMSRAGVSLSGGTRRVRYYSNINYLHQRLPFKTDVAKDAKYDPTPKNDWFNFRTNVDLTINNYLSGFLGIAGNIKQEKTTSQNNTTIYSHIFNLPPTMYGPLTPDGQVVAIDEEKNPVYGMLNRTGYRKALVTNVNAKAGLNLDLSFLTQGLKLSGMMAYHTNSVNWTNTTQDYERYTRTKDADKLEFILLGTNTNSPLKYGKSTSFYYNLNTNVTANYARTFGDHSINAMAYWFYMHQETESGSGSGIIPYKRESTGISATYGFKNRYFLKGDVGYSGSDQFHPDHRYMSTPAISAAWRISEEAFMDNLDWITNLKLRASYGVMANDQLGSSRLAYYDYISVNGSEGLMGNPILEAERVKRQNYGIDLGLFNELTLSVDFYKSLCDNVLVSSSGLIPEYQGTPLGNYPKTNTGKMKNHGVEIEAVYEKRLNKDLSFYVGGAWSFHKNKVLNVNETSLGDDYAYPKRSEGFAYGTNWGYLIDRSNGNGMFNFPGELEEKGLTYSFGTPRVGDWIYQDLNGDKIIDDKDKAPIGKSTIPEHYYSITGGLNWKGFELNFMFQGIGGISRSFSGTGFYEHAAQGVFNDIHMKAWTEERWNNDEEITYPALSLKQSTNHQPNDYFIMDASFLRLKNAEIAYTLPDYIARKISAEKIRVSLSGQNLFTVDNMRTDHVDPEIASMTSVQPYRVYNIGLAVTF